MGLDLDMKVVLATLKVEYGYILGILIELVLRNQLDLQLECFASLFSWRSSLIFLDGYSLKQIMSVWAFSFLVVLLVGLTQTFG